jgi:hypothetical protein
MTERRMQRLRRIFVENFWIGFRRALPWGLGLGVILMAWGAGR